MEESADQPGVSGDIATLMDVGIVSRRGAFDQRWVAELREDVDTAFASARAREGGAVPRGPQRWYVEVNPHELRGFVDLAAHPWVVAMCHQVLGDDYEIVEIGFDVSLPGASDQPWHRDFPTTPETFEKRRLTSLAFNLTLIDIVPEVGPMEVAPGTHWEPGLDFANGMFPDRSERSRYSTSARPLLPKAGDISARSALTIHRGTANRSALARPVLVLGVDGPEADNGARHDMTVTAEYRERLPEVVRRHLGARVVEQVVPVVQKHTIEGLLSEAPYDK